MRSNQQKSRQQYTTRLIAIQGISLSEIALKGILNIVHMSPVWYSTDQCKTAGRRRKNSKVLFEIMPLNKPQLSRLDYSDVRNSTRSSSVRGNAPVQQSSAVRASFTRWHDFATLSHGPKHRVSRAKVL